MTPDPASDKKPADQGTAADDSPHPTTSDVPLLPHAAGSAISTATDVASNAAAAAASTVKAAVDHALAWTDSKVEKLSSKEEDGSGPYGSVSTCAPSDMDPIGQGVLPAMPIPTEKQTEEPAHRK